MALLNGNLRVYHILELGEMETYSKSQSVEREVRPRLQAEPRELHVVWKTEYRKEQSRKENV
jgi:hypothetical protein